MTVLGCGLQPTLSSFRGSELCVPVLQVVHNGVTRALESRSRETRHSLFEVLNYNSEVHRIWYLLTSGLKTAKLPRLPEPQICA